MMTVLRLSGLVLTAAASATVPCLEAAEGGPAADKLQYHLFRPTPREFLREMSTDRPDKTESPYTVDAGRFQVEVDLVAYTHDRDRSGGGDTRTEGWAVAPVNFKMGLWHNVDLQTVLETYQTVRTADRIARTKTRQSGFGDITSRVKVNLWGNDGGRTALALMPFVKFPTNQDDLGNDSLETGVIIPLAVELPAGFGLGLMTEFDVNRDETGQGRHLEFVNSITVSRDLWGDLGGYVEFWSLVSAEEGSDWEGSVDIGFTYGLTEDIQLDAGVNVGVTRSAEDVNPFLGVSFRF